MLRKLVAFRQLKKNFSLVDSLSIIASLTFRTYRMYLPSHKRSIYLRKGTKDLETFGEVFLTNLYNVKLPIVPKNIIDAGANVGLASVFFKIKYPESDIVAIEIEKQNVEMFKKNTINYPDVSLENKALYSSKSFFKIEDPYHATNSFVVREVEKSEAYDIESITLDEIMEKKNWDTIDLLKIDIEGAEKNLFASNYQKWLPKTKIIMVETHDRMVPKCSYTVMKTINEYDFILYTTTEGTLIYFNMALLSI